MCLGLIVQRFFFLTIMIKKVIYVILIHDDAGGDEVKLKVSKWNLVAKWLEIFLMPK